MGSVEWGIILGLLGLAGLWHWTMQARELALGVALRGCRESGVQLLDHTVSLTSLRPRYLGAGRFILRRVYTFRYTAGDNLPREGVVILVGLTVETVMLNSRVALK